MACGVWAMHICMRMVRANCEGTGADAGATQGRQGRAGGVGRVRELRFTLPRRRRHFEHDA